MKQIILDDWPEILDGPSTLEIEFRDRLSKQLPKRFTSEQLARLAELMYEAFPLHNQLNRIFEEACRVLGEDPKDAETGESWAAEAIYNEAYSER